MEERLLKNKQIIKNSTYLYVRMLLSMFIGLYSSRLIFQALGVADFGIYNIVGGVVSMIVFFTSSLSNASQRFISIGIGKGNQEATTLAFRQSYTILLIVSLIVVLIGETLGLWFVSHHLVIPEERLDTALWLFQFSLISTVASLIQVSFLAVVISYEKMNVFAVISLIESFVRLLIACLLCIMDTDHLFLYGFLTALLSVFVLFFYICYCKIKYAVCQCSLYWDKTLIKEMSSFIGYTFFGCFSWSLGMQGIDIILNLFFGPVVNAARSISMQVSNLVLRFTDGITTAVKPQIIKSYASNDMGYMTLLIEKCTKFGLLFTIILVTPLLFETTYILELWLGEVPEYTVSFVQVVLCEQLIAVLVPPLLIAANATGKIKKVQVYGRIITLLSLPVSFAVLSFYPLPVLPLYVLIAAQLFYCIYCLWDIHGQLGLSIKGYLKNTIIPALCVFVPLVGMNAVIVHHQSASFLRLMSVAFSTLCVGGVLIYTILDKSEKQYLKNYLFKH